MMYAAEVENGIVTRVVVLVEGKRGDGYVTIGPENTVGIGWLYQDGEFTSPFPEGEPE